MDLIADLVFSKREDTCESGNEYNGELLGARISSVFVVLIASSFGAFFPILSSRYSFIRMPPICFFVAKYFGSGVIIATAFIHLLQPANEALSEDCLGGTFAEYPWAFAISLMTLFAMFFAELLAYRAVENKVAGQSHSHFGDEGLYVKKFADEEDDVVKDGQKSDADFSQDLENPVPNPYPSHFSHAAEHQDKEVLDTPVNDENKEQYYGQLLNVFVLEFGVVFHSVFVGIALAVSGEEFKTLYVVVVFHQLFEGLGLGTRIATTLWPKDKRWTPWLLAGAYGICTPIAIAAGLGVRTTYPPGSRRALITNGCFDAISSGILLYTGIVELMAHEFLYSNEFKGDKGFKMMLWAFFTMCWGAGLMALLGKWA